jgi:hypothetical protein
MKALLTGLGLVAAACLLALGAGSVVAAIAGADYGIGLRIAVGFAVVMGGIAFGMMAWAFGDMALYAIEKRREGE